MRKIYRGIGIYVFQFKTFASSANKNLVKYSENVNNRTDPNLEKRHSKHDEDDKNEN